MTMHEKKPILVSFLIVNYKSLAELERSLRDLNTVIAQDTCEILIANNDPIALPSSLKKIIPKAAHIEIYNLSDNRGFGAANNHIAAQATGKYLFFLNPDTYAFAGSYQDLMREIQRKACDIIAPVILNADGSLQMWSSGDAVTPSQIILNNLRKKEVVSTERSDDTGVVEVDWVTGAAFLMKKADFDAVGGFDEKFFLYFEDIDLCKRLRDHGKKIAVSGSLTLKHTSGASAVSKVAQKKNYFAAQNYYLKKHYGKITAKTFALIRSITHPS